MGIFNRIHRDQVFVAGGQPEITYVDRHAHQVEASLARALAAPNQIVSLSGPTKTGKTVLCRKVLGEREYVWIDGGAVKDADDLWTKVGSELNLPCEIETTVEKETNGELGIEIPWTITASGSKLRRRSESEVRKVHNLTEALTRLVADKIVLVIDDFHYLNDAARRDVIRNVKGGVFSGLKVLLLSVTHRAFDAIKAESELTGRFTSVTLPHWTLSELLQIASLGFEALKVDYDPAEITRLADEAQSNPFLMQKFCWERCFDASIDVPPMIGRETLPPSADLKAMFVRLAQDAGLPIYQKLVAGPQSRKIRTKRPLISGGEADIYEVTLLALAETGPKPSVSYEELRTTMQKLLADKMPQKHEITSALKHLQSISTKNVAESDSAIDWDEDKREINLADPYLRFYLRWQVRSNRAR